MPAWKRSSSTTLPAGAWSKISALFTSGKGRTRTGATPVVGATVAAFAVALLFTFANYNFRWGVTVSFSLTFAIPPLMLLCGWIARSAPAIRATSWTWLAVLLGVWMGGGNPYLGFFAAQAAIGETAKSPISKAPIRKPVAQWAQNIQPKN